MGSTNHNLDAIANFGADFIPDIIVSAQGSELTTSDGTKILDWTSGQMASLLGHCHPEIAQTIKTASENLDHLSSCMLSPPVLALANRLTSLLPDELSKAMFFSTGSESNEAAIRLAKAVTGKFEIVALGQSWHGMTMGAQGAQYQAGRRGHGPPVPGQFTLPQPNAYRSRFRNPDGSYDWKAELDYGWELYDQASCGSFAACLVECIQGDGGIHVLPPGYLQALKHHCERRGALLIVNEAQTGLGRTGTMFAFQDHGIVPDILTSSKPLANGLPLSAVVVSAEINSIAKENGFLFFTTHANDPLVAAVGTEVLEIVLRDALATNARQRGEQLLCSLRRLQDRYSFIGDVRGRGLMVGIEVVAGNGCKDHDPELASRLSKLMLKSGLWCQLQNKAVFRIGPPINCTSEEIEDGLRILGEVFSTV